MDLEVVGHRVILTRDNKASENNASEKHLLTIGDVSVDRYDVRLLLTSASLEDTPSKGDFSEASCNVEEELLDAERYRDLEEDAEKTTGEDSMREDGPYDGCFRPSFAIPEDVQSSVPLSERQHQVQLSIRAATEQCIVAVDSENGSVCGGRRGPSRSGPQSATGTRLEVLFSVRRS